MKRTCKQILLCAALASLMLRSGPAVLADSLVTVDGDVLNGTVTKTATGYTVQTQDGPVDITADRVKRVLYDHPTPTHGNPLLPTGAAPLKLAPKRAVDPREITALTQQGEAAMAAGEFVDARDAFADLLSVDPKSALAGRGLGYAYLKLDKPTRAVKPLEAAAINPPLDRSLTMALAASLVASHNPMRAVKFVKTYLEAHPTPLDEPAINTLGIALSQADSAASKSALFADGVKLYNKLNAQLEANQTGKKRWGVEWQDADTVSAKQKARQEAQKKVDEAWAKLQAANAQVSAAQNELNIASNAPVRHSTRDQMVQAAQNKLSNASTAVDKAQSAYDDATKALAEVPGPTWPTAVALEDVDLSLSPGGAIASASPAPGTASFQHPDTAVAPVQTAPPQPDPDVKPEPSPPKIAQATPVAPTPAKTNQPATPKSTASAAPLPPVHLTRYAVGFAISPDLLVTAASAVEGATEIQIDTLDGRSLKAEVVRTLHGEGLALLKSADARLSSLPLAAAPTGGSLTCLGFPEVELFNPVAKEMPATGTNQSDNWTVSFEMSPRLPGGPLIKAGTVVGVELGDRDSELGQIPAATLKSLMTLADNSAHANPPATDVRQAIVLVTATR
jgi:tetratricopeptide (TPR) repeat protein